MISSLAAPIHSSTTRHGGVCDETGRSHAFLAQVLRTIAICLPLSRRAQVVRRCVPRRYWFRMALMLARAQGRLVSRLGGNGAFTSAVMLDLWLRELSFGGAYPMPMRVTGAEVVLAEGPKLYTWAHLPMVEIPLKAGLALGGAEPAVVADRGNVLHEHDFLVYGHPECIEALPVSGSVLSRVRSTLRRGKSVVLLADSHLGGALSDVPFRMSARLGVPVVFQWAELGPDGVVDVTFQRAPFPLNRTEDEIAANYDYLAERAREVLAGLGR